MLIFCFVFYLNKILFLLFLIMELITTCKANFTINSSVKGINNFCTIAEISCEGLAAILFMLILVIFLILIAIFILKKHLTPTKKKKNNKQRFLDPALFAVETTHVYVRIDNHKPPLSFVYKGPYKIVDRNPKYFALDIKGKLDKISVDRLKVAYLNIDSLNNEILLDTSPSQPTPLFSTNRASCDETHTAFSDSNDPDNPMTLPITSRVGRPIRRPAYLDDYVLQ